jgi:magnesium transporter
VIVDSAHYVDGARQDGEPLGLAAASRRSRDGVGFVWLAVSDPAPEDLEELRVSFGLPALAVEDAQEGGHQRPKLEQHGEHVFLLVKTARYDEGRQAVDFGEIDVFVGAHHAIVIGWRSAAALGGARRRLDERPGVAALGPMAAAWAALDDVIDAYEPVLDQLTDDLEEAEQAVFQRGPDQGERIYLLRREAARLLRALNPLLGAFEVLERGDVPELVDDLRPLFRSIGDHVRHLYEEVVVLDKALEGLLDANLAGVTVRQNLVLQKVSGWAAIAIVPTIITGIYGMNFRHMPELGWPAGYPLVLLLIAAVVVGLRRYFNHVGWF